MKTFQGMIRALHDYWAEQGCVIQEGYDLEMGAGTFNPITALRCLGPEPYRAAYVEPCRRPTDGRYGENPNRLGHYFQYQVIIKPSPVDLQEKYIGSLEAIGFDLSQHDIRFVHDDWESPTLGAWGLGWEVWIDGMEITQYTYFQAAGGQVLHPVTGELTYGLERIAMYLQEVDRYHDLQWDETLKYGDIYHQNEIEWSHYNFTDADTEMWFRHFDDYEREARRMSEKGLPIPAYDFVMKASHAFNLLDARGVISVTERTGYIGRIRDLTRMAAEGWLKSREALHFPLLKAFDSQGAQAEAEEVVVMEGHDFDPEGFEDFVLEIGCEELPASFVPIGCEQLELAMKKLLDKEGLSYRELEVDGTPRRLYAYVRGLAQGKAASSEQRRGPRLQAAFDETGQLSRAGQGFMRSLGLEDTTRADVEAGKCPGVSVEDGYLYGTRELPGRATVEIFSEQLGALILGMDFPKSMRWSDLEISWARPIRWIVALHGEQEVPFVVGNVTAGRSSYGHRQLAPGLIELACAADYAARLREAKVMLRAADRQALIEQQLGDIEQHIDGKVIERDAVMPQVVNLVEWPTCLTGEFHEGFLQVPQEVLISEMVEHQKYFPVQGHGGGLLPLFVITSNAHPTQQVRVGNQRVLSARLSDGAFLYKQDLKSSFEQWNEQLRAVTFQRKLGSVYDKVQRIESNAEAIHQALSAANHHSVGDREKTLRAAQLCKADLASQLVYEFPELQGVVGRHYGLQWGEDPVVAQAIDEHWMPRGESEPLPETAEGMIVGLSDKIDNLLGCFLTGQKPRSSSDPYALRRQVLGMIRMLIEHKLYLPLMDVFSSCSHQFSEVLTGKREDVLKEIEDFITNRIRTVFQSYGFTPDEIVASLRPGFKDIYETYRKVQALHEFRRNNEAYPLLMEVYKRARGQLEGAEQHEFNTDLLQEAAEKALSETLSELAADFEQTIKGHDYAAAYALVAQLQPKIARLFDEVRILADDEAVRNNRLALLQRVFGLFDRLLDLGALQDDSLKHTAAS